MGWTLRTVACTVAFPKVWFCPSSSTLASVFSSSPSLLSGKRCSEWDAAGTTSMAAGTARAGNSPPKRPLLRGSRVRRWGLGDEAVQGGELCLHVLLPDGHALWRG